MDSILVFSTPSDQNNQSKQLKSTSIIYMRVGFCGCANYRTTLKVVATNVYTVTLPCSWQNFTLPFDTSNITKKCLTSTIQGCQWRFPDGGGLTPGSRQYCGFTKINLKSPTKITNEMYKVHFYIVYECNTVYLC